MGSYLIAMLIAYSDKIYYKWRFCDKYRNFIYSDNPKVDNLSYYTKVGHTDFESEQ